MFVLRQHPQQPAGLQRIDAALVEDALAARDRRIAELEQALARWRAAASDGHG